MLDRFPYRFIPRLVGFVPGLVAATLLTLATSAPAQEAPSTGDVAALVRGMHFEGVPYDAARALGPDACDALLTMLGEPEEAPHHANIVEALGLAGCSGGVAALAAYAARAGEVDGNRYRALRAVPLAMGHLARVDPRALVWLLARADDATLPAWSHGHHQGPRLVRERQRRIVSALGVSGRPAAEAWLQRHAEQTADPRARARALEGVERSARIRRDGPGAVLGNAGGRAR